MGRLVGLVRLYLGQSTVPTQSVSGTHPGGVPWSERGGAALLLLGRRYRAQENQSNWVDFKREKGIVVAKKYMVFVTKNKKKFVDMQCYYNRQD